MPMFTTLQTVDMRRRAVTIPGQEVLTADSVSLKVSLAVRYEIADPVVAVNQVQNVEDALYLEIQNLWLAQQRSVR